MRPCHRHADALIALLDTVVLDNRERVVTLAAANKLSAIYEAREFVQSGGLMSYGTNFADHFASAAGYVGKILRGTEPGALPVQQPTKFELVINLKTAHALGLDVPARHRRRGNRVSEGASEAGAISRCKSGPGKA